MASIEDGHVTLVGRLEVAIPKDTLLASQRSARLSHFGSAVPFHPSVVTSLILQFIQVVLQFNVSASDHGNHHRS